jgi:hypothetical protein
MTDVQIIDRMLHQVIAGERIAYSSSSLRDVDPGQTVVCHFDFEPRLRYTRYISSFQRILNRYTSFDFEVASIKRGCIDVCYYAKDFQLSEKNLVRRQIMRLMREENLKEEFCIKEFTLFGKHRYSSLVGGASPNDNPEFTKA